MKRMDLENVEFSESSHPSLFFEGFVADLFSGDGKSKHFERVFETDLKVPEGYSTFFESFRNEITALPPCTRTAKASAKSRLAIGLGGESVLETSITLHRAWGVPYLPGSALKGLAARAARQQLEEWWKRDSEEYRILFGSVEDAGHVTFHDALWIPFKEDGETLPSVPLLADVMTVHHRDYYGGDRHSGDVAPPADWDDPNPVSFVSAHGSYLVALTGPEAWLDVAFTILAGALEHDGLGAKTAAGYGRMTLKRQQS